MLVVDTDSDEYVKVDAVSIQTYIPSKDDVDLLLILLHPFNQALTNNINLFLRNFELQTHEDEVDKLDKVVIVFVVQEPAVEENRSNKLEPE